MQQLTEFGLRLRSADGDIEIHPAASREDALAQASYIGPEALVLAEVVHRTVTAWEADR